MSKISVRRLLAAIVDLYRVEVTVGGPASALLSTALQAIAATPYPRSAMRDDEADSARVSPIGAALSCLEDGGPLDAVLRRLRDAGSQLDWLPDDHLTVGGSSVLDSGCGVVEIVGPDRMFRSPSTRVGFLLMSAGSERPVQQLAAEQVFHVVAGAADWRCGDADWRMAMPGMAVYIPPATPFAIRTQMQPMLALYCRRSEQDKAAATAKKAARREARSRA
jgi:mannose-6-phosphate isomerase-like protein (cupin superfamily)